MHTHLQDAQELLSCCDADRLLLAADVPPQQEAEHSHRTAVDAKVLERFLELRGPRATCTKVNTGQGSKLGFSSGQCFPCPEIIQKQYISTSGRSSLLGGACAAPVRTTSQTVPNGWEIVLRG